MIHFARAPPMKPNQKTERKKACLVAVYDIRPETFEQKIEINLKSEQKEEANVFPFLLSDSSLYAEKHLYLDVYRGINAFYFFRLLPLCWRMIVIYTF